MPGRVPHCFLLHFPSLCEAGAREGLSYARRGARGAAPHGGPDNPLPSGCGTCGHPCLQEPQVHSRQKPLPWGGGVRPPGSGQQGPSGCRELGTTIPQCTGLCCDPEASVRTKQEPARPWWASLPSRPLYTWGQCLSESGRPKGKDLSPVGSGNGQVVWGAWALFVSTNPSLQSELLAARP